MQSLACGRLLLVILFGRLNYLLLCLRSLLLVDLDCGMLALALVRARILPQNIY